MTLTCGATGDVVYDVAGYKFLTATIGMPSNSSYAIGTTATITFYKDGTQQLSKPVIVTLDHPQAVHIALQGGSQLQISCSGVNNLSRNPTYVEVVLGTATISAS